MVFKKLLAGLGLGGVEVDTVLSPEPAPIGGQLTGQVHLRAKSDTDITGITLILVAGHIELARFPVAGALHLESGTRRQLPFSVTVPPAAPFTVLYGQNLPGVAVGVRTEVSVASGSDKGDLDPARIEAGVPHQRVMDSLGTIGCRFVRTDLRLGPVPGLALPVVQAVTFYAPIPEGQAPGPHVPQLTFLFAGEADGGLTVVTELASRPGSGDTHRLTPEDVARLSTEDDGWVREVDRWLINALDRLAGAPPGAFLQSAPHQASGHHRPQGPYGYGGHHGYKYGGYRPSMGGAIAAGVGGAALGFLGGMMLGDMIGDAFEPEMEDIGAMDGGFEDFGGDFGGDF